MAEFEKTTIVANVPAYVREEGTVVAENQEFITFKTKKRRSSRSLTRFISRKKIISILTKGESSIVSYVDEKFPIEFRNINFSKMSTSNHPGFVIAKLAEGTLTLNTEFMSAHTETSSAEPKLKKTKEEKKEKKKDKKKDK